MMNCTIREMTADDWTSVCGIYKQAIAEGKSTFQTECPSFEDWDKRHCKECRFVSVVDGKTAGWCALSPTSAREAYSGVVEVSIYFSLEYRHKGYALELLKHLINESEKRGFWCLYSAIFAINTDSIRLHEKCGVRRIGYREKIAKDRFGKWQDTVLFERRSKEIGRN